MAILCLCLAVLPPYQDLSPGPLVLSDFCSCTRVLFNTECCAVFSLVLGSLAFLSSGVHHVTIWLSQWLHQLSTCSTFTFLDSLEGVCSSLPVEWTLVCLVSIPVFLSHVKITCFYTILLWVFLCLPASSQITTPRLIIIMKGRLIT